jgi:hypothetical protein
LGTCRSRTSPNTLLFTNTLNVYRQPGQEFTAHETVDDNRLIQVSLIVAHLICLEEHQQGERCSSVETFTHEEFRVTLLQAVERTRDLAEQHVAEQLLPSGTLLVLDAFGQGRRASSVEEVLAYIYKDGTFPRVVVVGLRGIVDGQALVAICPSGHPFTDDRALTWNEPPEMGPFNCVGLMLRGLVWRRPRPLTREDLEESAAFWASRRTS